MTDKEREAALRKEYVRGGEEWNMVFLFRLLDEARAQGKKAFERGYNNGLKDRSS